MAAWGRAVLITGCDTGFGKGLTYKLLGKGYTVFAACYTQSAVDEYAAKFAKGSELIGRCHPVLMDVTSDESVVAAVGRIEAALGADDADGLWAVVNNAGVFGGHLLDLTSMDTLKMVMEVNMWGGVRVTKAVRHLLIKGPEAGRVVNVCSVAGRISSFCMGAYSASKYAFEAYSDALRVEMRPWGVSVHIIEPGFFKTPLLDKTVAHFRANWARLPEAKQAEYGKAYYDHTVKFSSKVMGLIAGNPTAVVDALEHAVGSLAPRTRYAVGWDANLLWIPFSFAPAWVLDGLMKLALREGSIMPAAAKRNMEERKRGGADGVKAKKSE